MNGWAAAQPVGPWGNPKSKSWRHTQGLCVQHTHIHEKQVLLFVLHFLGVGVHQKDISFRFFFIWFISVLPTDSFFLPKHGGKKEAMFGNIIKMTSFLTPFDSFCCCCCSLVAKQMEGTAQ